MLLVDTSSYQLTDCLYTQLFHLVLPGIIIVVAVEIESGSLSWDSNGRCFCTSAMACWSVLHDLNCQHGKKMSERTQTYVPQSWQDIYICIYCKLKKHKGNHT